MFGKKSNEAPDSFDTLVGSKTTFTGNIECEGTMRVDGTVKGDLRINGDVFIGTNGLVTGNISANNVFLSGTVQGNIHANGLLRLLSTSKLYGDIQVHSFVTDEGAIIQGKCSMTDITPSEKTQEKSEAKKKDYKKSSVITPTEDEKEIEAAK